MPAKKKQHYVPQFYLRNFSWKAASGQPIKVFNIDRGEIFQEGNLRNQCYEDFLYGHNGKVEDAFGEFEKLAAPLVRGAIEREELPKRFSPDFGGLLKFILLQYARTLRAGEEINAQVTETVKEVLSRDASLAEDDLTGLKAKLTDPVGAAIGVMAECIPLAYDLQMGLLVNDTPTLLVTSDHPVVFHNEFAGGDGLRANLGLASRGLEIFFPISPRHALILFDEKVYKVGTKKKKVKTMAQESDIRALNDLQWASALENIYFHCDTALTEIDRGYKASIERRKEPLIEATISQVLLLPEGGSSTILKVARPQMRPALRLEAIKALAEISDEERHSTEPLVRDHRYVELHRLFLEEREKGTYRASQFFKFLNDKGLI